MGLHMEHHCSHMCSLHCGCGQALQCHRTLPENRSSVLKVLCVRNGSVFIVHMKVSLLLKTGLVPEDRDFLHWPIIISQHLSVKLTLPSECIVLTARVLNFLFECRGTRRQVWWPGCSPWNPPWRGRKLTPTKSSSDSAPGLWRTAPPTPHKENVRKRILTVFSFRI